MVIPRLNNGTARLGASATMAVVVVSALIATPTGHRQLRNEVHQVQLSAVVVGAVGNTAPPAVVAESAPVPAAFGLESQEATTVAAATEDNFFDTPLGTALSLANFVALPLWFFFTPITLPLSMLAGASTVTMDGAFGTLQFLIATGLAFIGGPLGLFTVFMNSSASSASSAAAEVPGGGRPVAGDEVPTRSAETAAPAPMAGDVSAVPAQVNTERTSAVQLTRGRLADRPVTTSARPAAAVTTPPPAVAETLVDSLAGQPVDEEQQTPSAGDIEQAPSSAPEGPSAKSRAAKSGSRR